MKIEINKNQETKVLVAFGYVVKEQFQLYSHDDAIEKGFQDLKQKGLFIDKATSFNKTQMGDKVVIFAPIKKKKITKRGQLYSSQDVRIMASKLYDEVKNYESVSLDLDNIDELSKELDINKSEFIKALVSGFKLSSYEFNAFRSKPIVASLKNVYLNVDKELQGDVDQAIIKVEGNFYTRDLASYPANVANSDFIRQWAEEKAKEYGFETSHLGQKELEELGMGGILGVNQGSKNPPYIVSCHYNKGNSSAKKKILLVGKGVTFDTGGYSLKPPSSMLGMKYDMHGCASVLGALVSIARLKLDVEVIALVGLVENMISGDSYRPGDIITQYNGMTVEIGNTDAEGRLVLADVLSYGVEKYKPDVVIDVATLTGACSVALGHHTTGLMTNEDNYTPIMIDSGRKIGEACWELPMFDIYGEAMLGTISDLSNISSIPRSAGTITAGKFLENFVGETPWIHLDIASTANITINTDYRKKGISGVGTRLLTTFAQNLS